MKIFSSAAVAVCMGLAISSVQTAPMPEPDLLSGLLGGGGGGGLLAPVSGVLGTVTGLIPGVLNTVTGILGGLTGGGGSQTVVQTAQPVQTVQTYQTLQGQVGPVSGTMQVARA